MNSEENSEVTSNMYTVRDLAELRLPGYPDTERAWLDRAKNGGWRFIEIKGRGRGGIKRVYTPPPEIMALIEAQERGEPPQPPPRYPVQARLAPVKVPIDYEGSIKSYALQPSSEWLILTTIAISEADWLPDSIKQDRSAQVGLAIKLYNLLCMHLGGDEAKWKWMMESEDALQHALHFTYDLDQIQTHIESV